MADAHGSYDLLLSAHRQRGVWYIVAKVHGPSCLQRLRSTTLGPEPQVQLQQQQQQYQQQQLPSPPTEQPHSTAAHAMKEMVSRQRTQDVGAEEPPPDTATSTTTTGGSSVDSITAHTTRSLHAARSAAAAASSPDHSSALHHQQSIRPQGSAATIILGTKQPGLIHPKEATPSSTSRCSSPPAKEQTPQMRNLSTPTPIKRAATASAAAATDDDDSQPFDPCPIEPPITPESLAELETVRMFNNPKLRHDVNFDRDLHFRANIDGARGKQKARTAKRFWKAVEVELKRIEQLHAARQTISTLLEDEELKAQIRTASKRLPKVFASVRDILKSLVPEAEQSQILERLDVDLLMQQIVNGVLDMEGLANWLAGVIKTHCAPMRDDMVNTMEQTVIDAARNQDVTMLTDGLRQLVDIMEAMKLDVANHQIRHIRLLLIKNTVEFQQRYNTHRMEIGKMDTNKSLAWLKEEIKITHNEILDSTPLDAVCSALLWDMISPQGFEPFTPTFYLDYDRLRALSTEMHNYIQREIAHNLLSELLPKHSGDYFLNAWTQLQKYLAAITDSQEFFENNIEHLAAQIARIAVSAPANPQPQDQTIIFATALERLTKELAKDSSVFATHKSLLFHRVLPKLQVSVHKHIKLSAPELHDVLVPQAAKPAPTRLNGFGAVLVPAVPETQLDQDHNLVQRLTHIIVLHWQVWADVLYLSELDYDMNDYAPLIPLASCTSSDDEDAAYAPGPESLSSSISGDDIITTPVSDSADGFGDGTDDLPAPTQHDSTLPDH